MPSYLIIGRDHPNKLERRLAARDAHVELGDKLVRDGKLTYGGAMLDDEGTMIGSILVGHFESRQELDDWLKIEPYVTEDIWSEVEIREFRVGPSFSK